MKSMVRNALGDKIVNHYLPMTKENAAAFADKYFEGTYKVYEALSEVGNDTGIVAGNDVTVFVSNTESGKKAYLRMIVSATKNETEIRTALTGLTIEGFVVDKVSIINFSPMSFA